MATARSGDTLLSARRARPLRGPAIFFKALNFVLRDFSRSTWLLLIIGVVVAAQILLFNESPSRSHFFGVQYAFTMLVAGIASAALFARANRPEIYPILARPISRVALTGALMLAAWLIAVVAYVTSTLAVFLRYGPLFSSTSSVMSWLDLPTLMYGALPMLAISLVAISVAALLSTFVSPSLLRLFILSLIALLIMSFDNRNFPIEAIRPALQALPPVLAPVAGALQYATELARDPLAVVSLAMLAGYAFLLVLAVLWLSSTRESVLD